MINTKRRTGKEMTAKVRNQTNIDENLPIVATKQTTDNVYVEIDLNHEKSTTKYKKMIVEANCGKIQPNNQER